MQIEATLSLWKEICLCRALKEHTYISLAITLSYHIFGTGFVRHRKDLNVVNSPLNSTLVEVLTFGLQMIEC